MGDSSDRRTRPHERPKTEARPTGDEPSEAAELEIGALEASLPPEPAKAGTGTVEPAPQSTTEVGKETPPEPGDES